MDKKVTRLTGGQIQHLQDRFDVVTAEFQGGQTVMLRRRDDRMLQVETVRRMLGLKSTEGWTQVGKWVNVFV